MERAFNNIVGLADIIKTNTGIASFTKNDFDFINVSKCAIRDEKGVGISAKYIGPSSNGVSYNFMLFENGGVYQQPMIGKMVSDRSEIAYFSPLGNQQLSIRHNTDNSFAYNSSPMTKENTGKVGCGQAVADCISYAYAHHGWASVWLSIQSFWLWQSGAGIAAACVLKNCLPKVF